MFALQKGACMRRLIAICALLAAASLVGRAADSPYRFIKELPIGGGGG